MKIRKVNAALAQACGYDEDEMIVQMAEQLQKEINIEGVETLEQVELLTRPGCNRVQGFYSGQGSPLGLIDGLLATGRIQVG